MEVNLTNIPDDVQQVKMSLGIVGNAPGLIAAISRAIRVAPIDLSVLITGESGTGKEFFPKIIHRYSSRKHGKYIAVNCGAIPEGTIDSELFGHEKGAFTGAVAARKGYFEEADGGTIFLDEVAELPLTTQARLLRVLETGEFIKVGSSTVQKSNVRIVAATNVDMQQAVSRGRFREDLYYRLSTVSIGIPPLRDRGNDVLLLARKFAGDFAERYRTEPVTIGEDARHLLLRYRWPGNVRQLKNVIDQASLFNAGSEVDADDISGYLPRESTVYTPTVGSDAAHDYGRERDLLFSMILKMQREIDALRARVEADEGAKGHGPQPRTAYDLLHGTADVEEVGTVEDAEHHEVEGAEPVVTRSIVHIPRAAAGAEGKTLEETERETIRKALQRNDGRRKATARELNISERTLYRKIKEYGLEG